MTDKPTYIYVIAQVKDGKFVGPSKIGISAFPYSRLNDLQIASPFELGVQAAYELPSREIALAVERSFHAVKAGKRLRGEWFDIEPTEAGALLLIALEAFMQSIGLSDEDRAASFKLWTRGEEE